ncbi:MAG TPA: RHS repeat-associated core domain-containing protein [Xanthobacteraceae bacterium]|jgi:RHS repeat-associated protein
MSLTLIPGREARILRAAAAALLLILSAIKASPAMAQVGSDVPPPIHSFIDANGINLIDGSLNFSSPQVSVGQPGSGGMARIYPGGLGSGALWSRDNYSGTINSSGSTYTVSIGNLSTNFTLSGSTFTSQQGDGSTLTLSGTNYTLTLRDGTTAIFSTTLAGGVGVAANVARITTLTKPNGEVDTYTYTVHSYQILPPFYFSALRIDAITNNFGYEIKYLYQGNGTLTLLDLVLKQIIAINNAVDYCAPTATSCTLSTTWPTVTFNSSTGAVTDNLGQATTYPTIAASTSTTYVLPSGLTTTYTTDSSSRVITVANSVGTWHYAYSTAGSTLTTTVTDPNSHTRVVVSNTSTVLKASDTNGLSQTTNYAYDSYGRLTKITLPETDFISYTYDARGNITQTTVTGKDQVSTLSTTANFDATCTQPAKCNQPNWIKDAKGNETDYTYNTSTGQVLSVISPAGANGLRPETDFAYTSEYAWYKNSAGSIVQAASPISLLTQGSQCATAQTCPGSINLSVSALGYGSSGVANNLLPVKLTHGSGDGSLSAITATIYDSVGNPYTVQDPNGNVTRLRFDTVRQKIGVVGPDPDGAGPLHNRAVRITYECDSTVKSGCDGLVTLAEQGTVASQSDSDWLGFAPLEQSVIGYDGIDRKVTQKVSSAGTYINVAQLSYDNANRMTCAATRMNPSAIGSLPASACTLGTQGSAGPDRITYFTYDNADRLLKRTEAYGTALQADAVVRTLGADNEVSTLADARGDLTTIVRDTFNRVYQVEFPTPSNGGVSSTTDYEQYTYDNNGNITQNRRRSGTLVNFGYDALNLRTSGYNGATYGYDNLGRMTAAAVYALPESFGYDALNRQISETGPLGTIGRQYDPNGNLTRLTYPDNYYVVYSYDATNELTGLTDSNSVTLLQQTYNNLGQISSITRASGPSEMRGYGSDLRLSSQAYSFSDTSKNVTFSYTYNLAGQPMTMIANNAAYNGTTSPAATSYASDGQNRYTTVGAHTMTYDGRSNLQNDGTNTFSYDGLNRILTLNGTAFNFDALDRQYRSTSGSTNSRLLYSGQQVVGSYDASGNLVDRYVPGPQLDQTFLWYPGSSTSVSGANWLVTNAFGSVVAGAFSGTAETTTYDGFGISGSSGLSTHNGNMGFKGMMLSSISPGFYNARARTYDASLGRFLQSDPAGYADGMHLYTFVHNSPINNSDPSGLSCFVTTVPSGTVTVTDPDGNEQIINSPGYTETACIPDPTASASATAGNPQPKEQHCVTTAARVIQGALGLGQLLLGGAQAVEGAAQTLFGVFGAPESFGATLLAVGGGLTNLALGATAATDGALLLQAALHGDGNPQSVFAQTGQALGGPAGAEAGEQLNVAAALAALGIGNKTTRGLNAVAVGAQVIVSTLCHE